MENNESDFLSFADEDPANNIADNNVNKPWKILIVDDDEEMHAMTKMVLSDYSFEGRTLNMHSSFSGAEALEFLDQEEDIALIILDVVMETDEAGLVCAKNIREKLNNTTVRIILRTGQPGQAPEEEIILNYDINDYKAKTELTSTKLFTSVTASLRSYQHIKTIEHSRQGLEFIINSSSRLLDLETFPLFTQQVLEQFVSMMQISHYRQVDDIHSLSALYNEKNKTYELVAASGEYANKIGDNLLDVLAREDYDSLMAAEHDQQCFFTGNSYTACFKTHKGEKFCLYLRLSTKLSSVESSLISILSTNVCSAFENISLTNEIKETQKEIIFTLAEVVEGRSKETASHIQRVSAVSVMLAKKIQLSEHDVELLRLAAPMHDIGKIGTPDSILKFPGKLSEDDYSVMKQHAALGFSILNSSKREMLMAAAKVANLHHEKWDGTGYPNGLKGEEIDIFGRIVALADVVDALNHARCYKEAWGMDKVVEVIQSERGKHFDPQLVDIFLDSLDEYDEILTAYPI